MSDKLTSAELVELGRLVMMMPWSWKLIHRYDGKWVVVGPRAMQQIYDTPTAALQATFKEAGIDIEGKGD
jgi:hypothetical protein